MQALHCSTWTSLSLWYGLQSHGLSICSEQALYLRHAGSEVVACRFSFPTACRILVSQAGIKPVSSALEVGSLATEPPGKSLVYCVISLLYYCDFSLLIQFLLSVSFSSVSVSVDKTLSFLDCCVLPIIIFTTVSRILF